jgi:phosphatidyl-N-methylethanolamine N-methyltransferase
VDLCLFAAAAVLLSLERLCYLWIWRAPQKFTRLCAGLPLASLRDPVNALRELFCAFKLLQLVVFTGWCSYHGGVKWLALDGGTLAIGFGGILIMVGQALNLLVFYRLGCVGVFYGNKFGRRVPWNGAFPFSLFAHPQYVGAVLTIWGFFLLTRFPHADWYFLPLLETAYYIAGAYLEQ